MGSVIALIGSEYRAVQFSVDRVNWTSRAAVEQAALAAGALDDQPGAGSSRPTRPMHRRNRGMSNPARANPYPASRSREAMLASNRFFPTFSNSTVTISSPPSARLSSTTPSPKAVCRTRCPASNCAT